MQRMFTSVALSTLACLFFTPLIAQPITTAASINYTEVTSFYDFDLDEEIDYTFGPNMTFDFSPFADVDVELGVGPDVPAKDAPVDQLVSYSMFRIDGAYRDTFAIPLPTNVVGLRIVYQGDNDVEEDILTVKSSGLYYYGSRDTYEEDDEMVIETALEDGETPFVPLNLGYGEQFDTSSTYRSPSQFAGLFDSTIVQTTFTYVGYGTTKSWVGQAEAVGAILIIQKELEYRPDEGGVYGDPIEYNETAVYLMTDKSVLPRVVLGGDYDVESRTLSADFVGLLLPTSENPSAMVSNGIPGAAIAVFPNPTDGRFSVDLTLDRATTLDLEFFSAAGQRLSRSGGVSVVPGLNRLPVSDGTLAAGLYLVKLTLADGSSETQRVVVN